MFKSRRFSRARRFRPRRGLKFKKVVKGGTRSNINKLAKTVKSIQKTLAVKAENVQYQQGFNIANMTQDYVSTCLTQYASWTPCFGASVVDGTDNKAFYRSATIDCRLSIENLTNPSELDTLDYTIFLVSVRDEASNIASSSNTVLTMVNGRDYTTQGVGGMMVRLNPKMFKIHRMKRLTTTNFGASLQYSSAGNFKPIVKWTWKVAPRRAITNPIGDWSALVADRDLSKNYYLIAFNNNSSVDGTFPQLEIGTVHTVQVQGA